MCPKWSSGIDRVLKNYCMYGAADRYAGDDLVSVPLFGDLVINLAGVFAE
jgi:hypothetical protein